MGERAGRRLSDRRPRDGAALRRRFLADHALALLCTSASGQTNRIGSTQSPPDDGAGTGGITAALHGDSPILFRATGATSAEAMGQPGEVICRRDRLCDYAPDRGAVAGPTLGDLAGENASGPWKLCIGDSRPGSPGTLDRVELTITPGGRDGIECGNHKVEYGEQCEDGNTLSGDGCNGQCRLETFVLTVSPSSQIVGAGEGASYQLDVASVGGFAEEVELSVTSNPRLAATIAFSANPVRAPGTATLTLETTPATAPGTYDLTLTAASGGVEKARKVSVHVVSAVIPSSDTPIDIPDNDRAGITSTIVVLAPLEVHTIAVELDITHTFIGELLVTLTSPRGTEVTVHDRVGSSADDIQQIYLFPDRFRGESADGEWTLSVSDWSGTDVGTLDHWALGIMSVP